MEKYITNGEKGLDKGEKVCYNKDVHRLAKLNELLSN